MKKLILFLLWMLLPIGVNAGFVNNSGTSPEDSVSLIVMNYDSLGNPTTADSFFVLVTNPSGDSVFAENIIASSARLDSAQMSGYVQYIYQAAVADIDGAGVIGIYNLSVTAKSNSPALKWVNRTQFQLLSTEIDDDMSLIAVLRDSLNALLDTLQLYDTRWESLLAQVSNTSAYKADVSAIIDTVNATLDTLQNQDGWVATSANQTLIIDTVNAIIDSLQSTGGWIVYADTIANRVLEDSAHYQGTGNTLSAQEIVDSILAQTVSDTVEASLFSQLIRQMDLASDTTLWASLVDVWRNQDTANIDSSALGVWLYNNLSGSSGLTAQEIVDSILAQTVSDTVEASLFAQLIRQVELSSDTSLWASVQQIMDSMKTQIITLIADSILVDSSYYQGGTLTTNDTIYANIVEVDGDTTAAKALEDIFNNDATSNYGARFNKFYVVGANDPAFYIASTTGKSLRIASTSGDAVTINAQGIGNDALVLGSTSSYGMVISGVAGDLSGDLTSNITDNDTTHIYTADIENIADVTQDSISLAASTWTESEKDALLALLSIKNGKTAIRYVSDSGDGSDGLTWATAWTTFDSVNALVDSASMGLYEKTMVFIGAGDYDSVCCTIWTNNTYMIGSGRETKLSYWADYRVPPDTIPDSTEKSIFRVYSDYTYFMNMTLTSKDTVGDPEPGGGNCAIDFDARKDSSVHFGLVENCYFPAGHKHIQGSGTSTATGTSPTNIVIRNNTSVNPKLHFVDGVFRHSVVENNFIMGSVGYWDGSASIQILGGGTGGLMGGHSNVIKDNYFTNVAVGIALVYSDSNLITGNSFGTCNVPWTSSVGYNQNKFIGNTVEDYIANRDNIIENGSFEITGKDKGYPVGWAGNHSAITGDNGYAGQSTVKANRGRWSARIADSDAGAAAYLTTNVYYLRAGSYWWSGYWYPDKSGDDDMLVYLYKDKATGDSLHSSWTIRDADSTYDTWNATGGSFTVATAGNFYLSFLSSLGNDYYIDDISLQMVSLDTILVKTLATNNPTVFYGPTASGTGSDTVVIYAIDSSGTDEAKHDCKLSIKNASGTTEAVTMTDSYGKATFYLDPDTYTILGRLTGYTFSSASLTVSGNDDSVSFYGYDINISDPSSADLSRVYGWVKDISDNGVEGVTVTAMRTQGGNVVDTSAIPVIVAGSPRSAITDTLGYFYLDLRRTTSFADTTNGFYNIVGSRGAEKMFEVRQLYIPSTGNINLGDTLSGR